MKTVAVSKECHDCRRVKIFHLDHAKWDRWFHRGELIQNVFPELSVDDREMLISSMCPECWDKMWQDDDDNEDDNDIYCEVCGFHWEADSPCPYH